MNVNDVCGGALQTSHQNLGSFRASLPLLHACMLGTAADDEGDTAEGGAISVCTFRLLREITQGYLSLAKPP